MCLFPICAIWENEPGRGKQTRLGKVVIIIIIMRILQLIRQATVGSRVRIVAVTIERIEKRQVQETVRKEGVRCGSGLAVGEKRKKSKMPEVLSFRWSWVLIPSLTFTSYGHTSLLLIHIFCDFNNPSKPQFPPL